MKLFIYGTVGWFEKEEDCQIHIKSDITFQWFPQPFLPGRPVSRGCRGCPAGLQLLPWCQLPFPAVQLKSCPHCWSSATSTFVLLDFIPNFFTFWPTGVKSLWMFPATGSSFSSYYPLTIPALHVCKDVTKLWKSLKYKLLTLAYTYPFPTPFLRHLILAKT